MPTVPPQLRSDPLVFHRVRFMVDTSCRVSVDLRDTTQGSQTQRTQRNAMQRTRDRLTFGQRAYVSINNAVSPCGFRRWTWANSDCRGRKILSAPSTKTFTAFIVFTRLTSTGESLLILAYGRESSRKTDRSMCALRRGLKLTTIIITLTLSDNRVNCNVANLYTRTYMHKNVSFAPTSVKHYLLATESLVYRPGADPN